MSERTLALAVLLSVLLHGGVVAWLYSLDAGRWQPPVAIVPAFPVTEVVADAAPAAPRGRPGSSPSPAASRRTPPAPRAVPRPAPASAAVAVPEPAAPPEPLPAPGTAPDAAAALASTPGGTAAAPGDPGPLVGPSGGYQVRPVYPEAARRKGLEGTTVLRVHVRDDGSVAEVVVARSAGEPSLDEAAAGAVQRWRFEPARRGGHPVAVWLTLPVRFRLE